MQSTPWKIDKTINLPFLWTVGAFLAAAMVFGIRMDGRVANLEQANVTTASSLQQVNSTLATMAPRIERMDERGEGIRRDVDRLNNKLEK